MAAYRMTPARRAALKRAQAKSAAKRRGSGRGKVRRGAARVKKSYIAGNKGKGAVYRRQRDRFKSQGAYKNRTMNKKSKRAGKVQRGYRKASVVATNALTPYAAATTGVSYLRHRSAVKNGQVNQTRKQRKAGKKKKKR